MRVWKRQWRNHRFLNSHWRWSYDRRTKPCQVSVLSIKWCMYRQLTFTFRFSSLVQLLLSLLLLLIQLLIQQRRQRYTVLLIELLFFLDGTAMWSYPCMLSPTIVNTVYCGRLHIITLFFFPLLDIWDCHSVVIQIPIDCIHSSHLPSIFWCRAAYIRLYKI